MGSFNDQEGADEINQPLNGSKTATSKWLRNHSTKPNSNSNKEPLIKQSNIGQSVSSSVQVTDDIICLPANGADVCSAKGRLRSWDLAKYATNPAKLDTVVNDSANGLFFPYFFQMIS